MNMPMPQALRQDLSGQQQQQQQQQQQRQRVRGTAMQAAALWMQPQHSLQASL